MTVDILNWDKYATDPVVLAYKQAVEAFQGSANMGKLAPGFTDLFAASMHSSLVSSLEFGWHNKLHMPVTAKFRIASVKTHGHRASLTSCAWGPSYGYYDKQNKWYGPAQHYWLRFSTNLRNAQGSWKITGTKSTGKCQGGAPR
ncbi:hypothetical protein AB3X52_13240 [Nocardioides sp. DS6]|uniref:SnoaL-like domain-containing protein n=1 Tax=Nocardioides eburneus TaxID=3231482 RepID=A0ABV3T074_9ACTN